MLVRMQDRTKIINSFTGYNLKAKRKLALYNMIPNLVWSVINLAPITLYYIHLPGQRMLYLLLIFSLIPFILRRKMIDKMQLGSSAKIYKRLGVHLVSKVSQNGEIINRLVKRKHPDHKIVSFNKQSIEHLISQTYMFEKFHLCLFIFFILTSLHALFNGSLGWAFIFILTNIAYNVYPNLLQQYIRTRLQKINI